MGTLAHLLAAAETNVTQHTKGMLRLELASKMHKIRMLVNFAPHGLQ